METRDNACFNECSNHLVLEVTMRDGNLAPQLSSLESSRISVLEVTMRDGNVQLPFHSTLALFLVLEVTMRDGNHGEGEFALTILKVLEVTMRDGNLFPGVLIRRCPTQF